MKLLSVLASACLCLSFTQSASGGEPIRSFEPKAKLAKCRVDPDDETKLYCDNYCQMNSRTTLEKLGPENLGWNCDNSTNRNNWKNDWNANNPNKQVTTCDAGSNSATGFHQGMCDVLEDSLAMPPVINASSYIVWNNVSNECMAVGMSDAEYAAAGCPIQRAYVQFNNDMYEVYSNGSAGAPNRWVTSSDPSATPTSLADRYEMTVTGQTGSLTTVDVRNNYLMLEYLDPRPDRNRPGIGTSELDTYTVYIRTCEIGNPANCADTQVNFNIAQDHG